jgi:hypothetical protein
MFEIKLFVEDSMGEIYNQPGAKQQVEGAALRKLFELRDAWQDRVSRQSVLSRGFVGTEQSK